MALVIETGSGVRGANAYVNPAFVTAYLTDRGRVTENLWSTIGTPAQDAACIGGTDYIDTRWGPRFRGVREFAFLGSPAQALVTFSGIPSGGDTITIGELTYIYRATLTYLVTEEILIGGSGAASLTNLIAALQADDADGAGVTFSESQIPNSSSRAALREGTTLELLLTAVNFGLAGNDIPLAVTGSEYVITTAFRNGTEAGSQGLEFPRAGLVDRNGLRVTGVPTRLKDAAAEYAVRAAGAALYRDPTVDDTGRAVIEKEERTGPLLERTVYESGSALSALIKPYPAADAWLEPYLQPSGGSWR